MLGEEFHRARSGIDSFSNALTGKWILGARCGTLLAGIPSYDEKSPLESALNVCIPSPLLEFP